MEVLHVLTEMAQLEFGGCIFCSEKGSGEHITGENDITEQINSYFKSYKAQRANKFIAYFQNFTNTYDTIEHLKSKYHSALIHDKIVGLAIATRPDCINKEVVELLNSFTNKYHVWVELGLQTSNNETGELINRGYSSEQFTNAVKLLNQFNIDTVTHIMLGLPNETRQDLMNTIAFINGHHIQGLKIHSCYVIKNTVLAKMYEKGIYTPISLEDYLDGLVYVLTHIHPDLVIHRITGDAPKDLLLAPNWNLHKKWVMNGLEKILRENNLWQGMYYNHPHHL